MNKTGKILIDKKEYTINAWLTISDYEKIIDYSEEDDSEECLTEIIRDHIPNSEGKPNLKSLKDKEIINKFIEMVLNNSETLRETYNSTDSNKEVSTRFIMSVKENAESIIKPNSKLILTIPSIKEQFKPLYDNQRIMASMRNVSDSIKNTMIKPFKTAEFAKAINQSIKSITIDNQKFINAMMASIKKALQLIPSSILSEEQIENIRQIYKGWGDYGWSIFPGVKFKDIVKVPTNKKESDEVMIQYCNDNQMQIIFEETINLPGVKKSDYKEAISDYENQNYKSCALLLFSLIESKLIRMQKRSELNTKRQRREVGTRAAKILFDKEIKRIVANNKYSLLFRAENIYSCLKVFFKDGNDFKCQPDVTNRQFLSHGMFTGRVKKKDCKQLFVFYYNYIDYLNQIKK